jgi:hypothetical protein
MLSEKLQSTKTKARPETFVIPENVEETPKYELELHRYGRMITDTEPPYTCSATLSQAKSKVAKFGDQDLQTRRKSRLPKK